MYYDLSLPFAGGRMDMQVNDREKALANAGHHGTHLDRLLHTQIPLEYFKSRAIKIDVSAFSRARTVEVTDLPLEDIRSGDFVFIHSGAMRRHGYGTRPYLEEFFEISWEALEALLSRKIRYIGVDSRGIRPNQEHAEADTRAEKAGAYVIENMNNTELLPGLTPFTAYTVTFDMGGTGIPCRVIAEL
jgi:kynurenine formamidase